jgi:hypothetical protein
MRVAAVAPVVLPVADDVKDDFVVEDEWSAPPPPDCWAEVDRLNAQRGGQ